MSDLIRREDVKRMINGKHLCVLDERILINALGDIPSAEPKVGRRIIRESASEKTPRRWKVQCPECHKRLRIMDRELWNYCPNCGARMEGE